MGHEEVFIISEYIWRLATLYHHVKNYLFFFVTIQNCKAMAWSVKHNPNPTIKSKYFEKILAENRWKDSLQKENCVWTVYRKRSWAFDSALEGFSNLVAVPETSITRDRCRLFLSAACPESIKLSRAVNVLPTKHHPNSQARLKPKYFIKLCQQGPRVELSNCLWTFVCSTKKMILQILHVSWRF